MKRFIKSVVALALTLAMVLSVSTSVFAYSKTYSFGNAKKIAMDKPMTVDIPANTQKTYYKLVLSKKTKINVVADYTHGYFYMYDPDLNVILDDDDDEDCVKKGDLFTFDKTMVLNKGTYYFSYDSSSGCDQNILHFTVKNMNKPSVPTITKVDKKTGTIKGKTVKNAKVYVKIGNATYDGKANSKGVFSIETAKLKADTKITVWAKSANGVKASVLNYVVQ